MSLIDASTVERPPYVEQDRRNVEYTPIYWLSDAEAARHLDATGAEYFTAINPEGLEGVAEFVAKLRPLQESLPRGGRLLSIGVGQGSELLALGELFGDSAEILGADICQTALDRAATNLDRAGVEANLIKASATDLPFKESDGTGVDGVVHSALLHEVYSYIPDGKLAFDQAAMSTARALNEGGVWILRDFATPPEAARMIIFELKTEEAKDFYDYFRSRFRTFPDWDPGHKSQIKEQFDPQIAYPPLDASGRVRLRYLDAAELMLHFRNYVDHTQRGLIARRDAHWKEADERYLIPHPGKDGLTPMPVYDYTTYVAGIANAALEGTDFEIEVLQSETAPRPSTADFHRGHFGIYDEAGERVPGAIESVPKKMELLFRKVRRNVSQMPSD